jgi:hypothetical protein
MLVRREIDGRAQAYVESQLRQGGKYARACIASAKRATCFSHLPPDLDYSVVDLGESIMLRTGIRIFDESRRILLELVGSFIGESDARIAVVETYYRPNHLPALTSRPRILSTDDEILFALTHSDDRATLHRALTSARDYPFVCGLIDLGSSGYDFRGNGAIRDEDWTKLIDGTRCLIVGAFDNEGFLICPIEADV